MSAANRLFTTAQAAEALGIKAGTLTAWRSTARHELPYVKVGRSVRYSAEAVEAFLSRRTVTNTREELSP